MHHTDGKSKLNQQDKAPVIVARAVLLSPGHAPGEEAETDAPAFRRLAEVQQPSGQLGAAGSPSPEVAAEAADEPVRGLVGLLHLLQKVVIFDDSDRHNTETTIREQFKRRPASTTDQKKGGTEAYRR